MRICHQRSIRASAGWVLATLVAMENIGYAQAQTLVPIDRRSQVAPERAQRIEALLSQMFPKAALDWNREELVHADGRRQRFNFSLYTEKRIPRDGSYLVVASPAPDEAGRRVVEQAQKPITASATPLPACKLHLMRIDEHGQVLGYREAAPDIDSAYACSGVNFDYAYESAGVPPPSLRGQQDPEWPWVVINYASMHRRPDALASLMWAAVLDTDTLRWVTRLPVWFDGARPDGRRAAFAVRNDRGQGTPGQWEFYGLSRNVDRPDWRVSIPCKPGACKVEPDPIIDAAIGGVGWR